MISLFQNDVPILKLNDLVLSELFFSIGTAYENDIGPTGVKKSNELPIEVLRLLDAVL